MRDNFLEVITTPTASRAMANANPHAGARPVFVEVGRDTGNIVGLHQFDRVTQNTELRKAISVTISDIVGERSEASGFGGGEKTRSPKLLVRSPGSAPGL
jgi:hypothetical protein